MFVHEDRQQLQKSIVWDFVPIAVPSYNKFDLSHQESMSPQSDDDCILQQ